LQTTSLLEPFDPVVVKPQWSASRFCFLFPVSANVMIDQKGRGQEVDDQVGVGGRRLGGRELDRDGVRRRRRLDPGIREFQEVLVGLGDLLDDVGAAGAELGGIENVDEDDVDLHRLTSVSDFVRLKPLC
jgi:hypothetical protein